jgi:hypothetical protein
MVYNIQNHRVSGLNTVNVSFLSPEEGNTSSFPNVMLSSYLEFRTFNKIQKPSDFE